MVLQVCRCYKRIPGQWTGNNITSFFLSLDKNMLLCMLLWYMLLWLGWMKRDDRRYKICLPIIFSQRIWFSGQVSIQQPVRFVIQYRFSETRDRKVMLLMYYPFYCSTWSRFLSPTSYQDDKNWIWDLLYEKHPKFSFYLKGTLYQYRRDGQSIFPLYLHYIIGKRIKGLLLHFISIYRIDSGLEQCCYIFSPKLCLFLHIWDWHVATK